MHEQSIIDMILENIDKTNCTIKIVSLLSSEEELRKRLMKDVASGKRTVDVIEKSISRISNYQKVDSVKINTDGKNIEEITEEILQL